MSEVNVCLVKRGKPKLRGLAVVLALVIAATGCASMTPGERTTAERTVAGGAIGAASGAIIGAIAGNAGLGAAAGAGAGLLGGFIYDQWKKSEQGASQ